MKQQYANELRGIKKMQEEVNEELAAKKRMMQGMQQECSKLRQQKYMLTQCRLEIEKKWGGDFGVHQRTSGQKHIQSGRSGHSQHHV